MISNKNFNPGITELSIRGRILSISLVSITQSYFQVPKDVRLNSTRYFIMKIPNKGKRRASTNCNKSFIRY